MTFLNGLWTSKLHVDFKLKKQMLLPTSDVFPVCTIFPSSHDLESFFFRIYVYFVLILNDAYKNMNTQFRTYKLHKLLINDESLSNNYAHVYKNHDYSTLDSELSFTLELNRKLNKWFMFSWWDKTWELHICHNSILGIYDKFLFN